MPLWIAQVAWVQVGLAGIRSQEPEALVVSDQRSAAQRNEPLSTDAGQAIEASNPSATTVAQEQAQIAPERVQVTGVRLNLTEDGLEVILATPNGEQLQPAIRSEGNRYIADINNAQLLLPSGNSFRQDNPVAGITEITVSSIAPNRITVTVTGAEAVPKVELFDSEEGLIFGVTPATSSTQAEQTPKLPQQKNHRRRVRSQLTSW